MFIIYINIEFQSAAREIYINYLLMYCICLSTHVKFVRNKYEKVQSSEITYNGFQDSFRS